MRPTTGTFWPTDIFKTINQNIVRFLVVAIIVSSALIVMVGPTGFGDAVAHAATDTIEIRFPVRESDFETVIACQNDSTPDCRSCLADQPNTPSLVMYSILQKGLSAGGLTPHVKAVSSPNSERSRKMVSEGFADIKSDWDFNIDANPDVLKSAPILRRGEVEKGIYVHEDKLKRRKNKSISDVHDMNAVSIRTWRLDWEVLESLGPKNLTNAATTGQIHAMINADRADFTLLEFSNEPDMAREHDGIRLLPMPGVKVILPGSQHFMISRHLPNAQKIVDALNSGIETLHRTGFIRQCLTHSGVVNERVKDWNILNPHAALKGKKRKRASH